MSLPPDFQYFTNKGKVCHFKKALYGFKQSFRAWFEKFCGAMLKNGLSSVKRITPSLSSFRR